MPQCLDSLLALGSVIESIRPFLIRKRLEVDTESLCLPGRVPGKTRAPTDHCDVGINGVPKSLQGYSDGNGYRNVRLT